MKRQVVVNLTQAEARALSLVAGNGWDSGLFVEYLGDKRKADATIRAMEKLDKARQEAR